MPPPKANNNQVVEEYSAVIGDAAEGKEGINSDHVGMTKFTGFDDEGYRKVSAVIVRYLKDIKTKGLATGQHRTHRCSRKCLND